MHFFYVDKLWNKLMSLLFIHNFRLFPHCGFLFHFFSTLHTLWKSVILLITMLFFTLFLIVENSVFNNLHVVFQFFNV